MAALCSGNYDEAVSYCNRYMINDKISFPFLESYGLPAYMLDKKYTRALFLLNILQKQSPNKEKYLASKYFILKKLGKYSEAKKLLDKYNKKSVNLLSDPIMFNYIYFINNQFNLAI